jgi:hypothetical protein
MTDSSVGIPTDASDQREWMEVSIPIRGNVLVQFDGDPIQHKVAAFDYRVPVRFVAPQGELAPMVVLMPPGTRNE